MHALEDPLLSCNSRPSGRSLLLVAHAITVASNYQQVLVRATIPDLQIFLKSPPANMCMA